MFSKTGLAVFGFSVLCGLGRAYVTFPAAPPPGYDSGPEFFWWCMTGMVVGGIISAFSPNQETA